MSMHVLTILQFLAVTGAYFIMTLLLPAVLLHCRIAHLRFSARFIIYQTVGNFVMMNLVFALQLLHISNRFTLTVSTAALFVSAYIVLHKKKPGRALFHFIQDIRRLAEGQYGPRLFFGRIFGTLWKKIKSGAAAAGKGFVRNLPDILLIAGVVAAILYFYGRNAWFRFGYCASDIPVHNYWINYLSKGELFVAGVYPFGFHCIIYYLHMVFGLDTYVLLRLFWLLQVMVFHFMLLAFVRYCTKAKYVAYLGMAVYICSGVFAPNTYMRFISSLPQEFGMIFIFPSIYFLLAFFEKKRQELQEHGTPQREAEADGREEPEDPAKAGPEKETEMEMEMIPTLDNLAEFQAAMAAEPADEDNGETLISLDTVVGETESGKKKAAQKLRGFYAGVRREFQSESTWYLVIFAMNFAMSLAAHFYDTMVAGLLCIGVAVGYGFRLFRRPYFGRVMIAGVLSIVVAALPMVLAFIGGTPLQGSLGWGMNIINGTDDDEEEGEEVTPEHFNGITTIWKTDLIMDGEVVSHNALIEGGHVVSQGDIIVNGKVVEGSQLLEDGTITVDGEVVYEGTFVSIDNHLPEDNVSGEETETTEITKEVFEQQQEEVGKVSRFFQNLKNGVLHAFSSVTYAVEVYLIAIDSAWLRKAVPASIICLALMSVLYFALRQTDYAARMLSAAAGMGCMTLLFISSYVSVLPELMDVTRASIYYAYTIIVVWCLCVDGALQLALGWFQKKWFLHLASFALVIALTAGIFESGLVKDIQFTGNAFQTNEAVTCLTNIIRENDDWTWTICSANDELRMGEDHGYHYEVHTFLKEMEHTGGGSSITIPTQRVYFFIEKVPIDYAVAYEGSGQEVSEKGAANQLPPGRGISMYQGKNRWIEMSRMYYWARKFQQMYPNEMKVYYETDNFICYCVEQNTYSLYNFSIDYGYNLRDYTAEQEG